MMEKPPLLPSATAFLINSIFDYHSMLRFIVATSRFKYFRKCWRLSCAFQEVFGMKAATNDGFAKPQEIKYLNKKYCGGSLFNHRKSQERCIISSLNTTVQNQKSRFEDQRNIANSSFIRVDVNQLASKPLAVQGRFMRFIICSVQLVWFLFCDFLITISSHSQDAKEHDMMKSSKCHNNDSASASKAAMGTKKFIISSVPVEWFLIHNFLTTLVQIFLLLTKIAKMVS